jgi:hypothetical protein
LETTSAVSYFVVQRKYLRKGTNSLEYYAPSWSWASIKDQVDMHPVSTSRDDELILEAEVIPADEDEASQLMGSYVKIYRPLIPARWAFYSTKGTPFTFN